MPDEVDKFLSEEQQLESRRQELIKDVLRQKESAIKAFDEKLARLGHHDGPAPKRSHHTRKSGVTETKQPEQQKGGGSGSR
jgi:hypothetical protein